MIRAATLTLLVALTAGCAADLTTDENDPALLGTGLLSPRQMSIDLSNEALAFNDVPLALVTPAMAENIGPGSHLFMDIPGVGTAGCTANFVWADGDDLYLGAAGHCFLPEDKAATAGPGADYDPSGVVVRVCVANCTNGGATGFTITGDTVALGEVAYARQTAASGDIGNDFGLVRIPASISNMVRPSMPVWGGPTTTDSVQAGDIVCLYGNGVGVGEVYPTMARVGIGVSSDADHWESDAPSSPGDSGSAVQICELDTDSGVRGVAAAGILTHLAVGAGLVVGTTVDRAIDMATEAGLSISLVYAQ